MSPRVFRSGGWDRESRSYSTLYSGKTHLVYQIWVNQYNVLYNNVPFGGKKQSGIGTCHHRCEQLPSGANSSVIHKVANWVATPLKNISPRKQSTGTTAKISNGLCRYLTRAGRRAVTRESVFFNCLFLASVIANGRMNRVTTFGFLRVLFEYWL